jgi:VanZ family protein
LAILFAALYAASDEFHQSFVPSRGPAVGDVLLDTEGATAAQLAMWLVLRRENRWRDEFETPVS